MKQATVKLPSGDFWIIGVPKGTTDITKYGKYSPNNTYYANVNGKKETLFSLSKKFKLLGADPTNLTEEEAWEIVDFDNDKYYRDYTVRHYQLLTALSSLDSLAASLGIEKPFVVLKNINSHG